MDKKQQIVDHYLNLARNEKPVLSTDDARRILNRKIIGGAAVGGGFLLSMNKVLTAPLRFAAAASVAALTGVGIWQFSAHQDQLDLAPPLAPIAVEAPAGTELLAINAPLAAASDLNTSAQLPTGPQLEDGKVLAASVANNLKPNDTKESSAGSGLHAHSSNQHSVAQTPVTDPGKIDAPLLTNDAETALGMPDSDYDSLTEITYAAGLESPSILAQEPSRTNMTDDADLLSKLDVFEANDEMKIFAGYEFGPIWQELDYLNTPLTQNGISALPSSTLSIGYFVGIAVNDVSVKFVYADTENVQVSGNNGGEFNSLSYDYDRMAFNVMYETVTVNDFALAVGFEIGFANEHLAISGVEIARQLSPNNAKWDQIWSTVSTLNSGTENAIALSRELFEYGPQISVSYRAFNFIKTSWSAGYRIRQANNFDAAVQQGGNAIEISESEKLANNAWAITVGMQVDLDQLF